MVQNPYKCLLILDSVPQNHPRVRSRSEVETYRFQYFQWFAPTSSDWPQYASLTRPGVRHGMNSINGVSWDILFAIMATMEKQQVSTSVTTQQPGKSQYVLDLLDYF